MPLNEQAPSNVPDILDLIASHATRRPDCVAITHLRAGRAPEEVTWSQLLRSSRAARHALTRAFPCGNIVPSYTAKSADCVALLAGAVAAGKTFASISPKSRLPQLMHALTECSATSALVDTSGLRLVRDSLATSERLRQITWLLIDPLQVNTPSVSAAADAIRKDGSLQELDTRADCIPSRETQAINPLDPDRPAVCLFTSGSTGTPKGVLVAWSDLYRRAVAECALFDLTHDDCLLSLLPFSFDVGLNQLMTSLVSGARLVILDSWMPRDILNAVASQGVTGISGVPSIWRSLLKSQQPLDRHGAHARLRYLTVSGGDMDAEHLRRLSVHAAGVSVFKTYGQSESFRSTALHPEHLGERTGSVGQPFGSARVYIVRPDGTPAEPGEQGEVVHTGLGVMLGYLNSPGMDQKRRPNPFLGPDDDSPFAIFTGDQGYLDEQGFLFLAGRQDDMVKVAGHRIHLGELAAEMGRIPGVLAAEAIALPVEDADPVLAVFVQIDGQEAAPTPQQLSSEAARRLPTYMQPRWIQMCTSFPLTASGKPDRLAMREEVRQRLHPG